MAIELSSLRFNNGDDIVPWYSAEEVILNTGVANTDDGNDRITGVGPGTTRSSLFSSGIYNSGNLNTGRGNDTITGTYDDTEYYLHNVNYVSPPNNGRSIYRDNRGNFYYYPEDPNGPVLLSVYNSGINNSSTIDTGEGDDIISGINTSNRGNGIGFIGLDSQDNIAIYNPDNIGIDNGGTIYTRGGNDSIISQGKFINYGNVYLGDDNDTITSYGVIYNSGRIETGNGDDSIIADTFYAGFDGLGSVSLEDGNDYVRGFGNGNFNGGQGVDTLELTSGGSYTVGISGTAVSFTMGNRVMITSEFEELRAGRTLRGGSTTYDFSSLTDGQIIFA
jgi:hypothetical protein